MDDISKRSLYYPDNQFFCINNDYHVGRWTQTHYLDWDIKYLNDFDAEGHLWRWLELCLVQILVIVANTEESHISLQDGSG